MNDYGIGGTYVALAYHTFSMLYKAPYNPEKHQKQVYPLA